MRRSRQSPAREGGRAAALAATAEREAGGGEEREEREEVEQRRWWCRLVVVALLAGAAFVAPRSGFFAEACAFVVVIAKEGTLHREWRSIMAVFGS